jgi:RNA polymerase sigma-70 factor (ECF subfamily)
MGQDDWLLMHRVADGDEGAVAELYDRFGSLVYKVARQLLPSRAEAEDAVQEVFIRLWQTADRYDPRRAKLVTWVMLIAQAGTKTAGRRKERLFDATGCRASRITAGGDRASVFAGIHAA